MLQPFERTTGKITTCNLLDDLKQISIGANKDKTIIINIILIIVLDFLFNFDNPINSKTVQKNIIDKKKGKYRPKK
ncbi:MAG: hypothetical protein LBC02_06210 [Planctomycetaceae bacterium]|nr:hypothetical protein [Planctomycetaceae bacterium]